MLYGNVTNTTRTHFQFDKIYPNRYAMEYVGATGRDLDDVYIAPGRFVLVSYAYDISSDSDFLFGYSDQADQTLANTPGSGNRLFIDATCLIPFKYTDYALVNESEKSEANIDKYYVLREGGYFKAPYYIATETYYVQTQAAGEGAVTLNQIVRRRCNSFLDGEISPRVNTVVINPTPQGYTEDFFICTGSNRGEAIFAPLNLADVDSGYFHNYYIDKNYYYDKDDTWSTLHRGYDNTVWQKVVTAQQEQYVLVAHLNALAPGLNIVAEPPTAEPVAPFLGADSTDLLYQLHIQTPWNISVKTFPANSDTDTIPSDTTALKETYLYDTVTKQENITSEQVPAAIYWNNAGMDKAKEVLTTTDKYSVTNAIYGSDNFIRLTKEQSSDFDTRYPNKVLSSNSDTRALEIYLPGVGDMVATGWNLVYGQPSAGTQERTLDTKWYTKSSPFKDTGDPDLQKKTHDLNCFAGCINVYHDKLGQIIDNIDALPTDDEVSALWDDSSLYYNTSNHNYYRKGVKYSWADMVYVYEPIELTEYTYTPFTYYIEDDGTYDANYDYAREGTSNVSLVGGGTIDLIGDVEGVFHPEQTYYCRKIDNSTNVYYVPIDLQQYEQSKYYYKNGENYFRDNAPVPAYPSKNYLDISLSDEYTFAYSYAINTYYLYDETKHKYTLDSSGYASNVQYYVLQSSAQSYQGFPYAPGVYYRREESAEGFENVDKFQTDDQLWWVLDNNSAPTPGRPYMLPVFKESAQYVYYYDEQGNMHMVKGFELDMINSIQLSYDNSYDPDAEYYYYENNTYTLVDANFLQSKDRSFYTSHKTYYEISMHAITEEERIYIPGYYYRLDSETGNLYFATEDTFLTEANMHYYLIDKIDVLPIFFEGDKYFVKNGDYFIKDPGSGLNNIVMQQVQHYEKAGVYVTNDIFGQCPTSYAWNYLAEVIPWPLTLKTRTSTYGPVLINNIDNGENSINGQILKLSQLIDYGNEDTRDTMTVQGGLNSIQDAIYTLGNLKPQYMLYVNDYGRIANTNITYAQFAQALSRLSALESRVDDLENS